MERYERENQLVTQLTDLQRALDAERADNAMAKEAYWSTIADLRSELATLQAQLTRLEDEYAEKCVAKDNYITTLIEAKNKAKAQLRQVVEALAWHTKGTDILQREVFGFVHGSWGCNDPKAYLRKIIDKWRRSKPAATMATQDAGKPLTPSEGGSGA